MKSRKKRARFTYAPLHPNCRSVVVLLQELPLSRQSIAMLEKLAALGIHGRSSQEVAARCVDQALARLAPEPSLAEPIIKVRRR